MQRRHKAKSGFIYLLLLMVIGISIFFYYYLINIDRKYSNIIEEETLISNHAQLIYSGANRGYFLLYKIFATNNHTVRDSLIIQRNSLVSKNDYEINKLLSNLKENREKFLFNNVIASREAYKQTIAKFDDFLITNKKDSANIFLANKIESSFLNYQENLISFIYTNGSNAIENSDKVTSDVKRKSYPLMLLGLSPIILFSLFLIVLGIFFILAIFVRDIEYDRYGE